MTKAIFAKIGNTRTVFWGSSKRELSFATAELLSASFPKSIYTALGSHHLIFVSVVPKLAEKILSDSKIKARQVSLNDIPIKAAYSKGLGIDRMLNLFAASQMTSSDLVTIDFGTAITVDFLSKATNHRGGWILPGLRVVIESLNEKTAQIPRVSLHSSKPSSRGFAGRSTKDCLLKGQVVYLNSVLDAAIASARRELSKNALCVMTGGDAILLKRRTNTKHEPELALKGLKKICEQTSFKM